MQILDFITRLHEYTCWSAMSLGMQRIMLVCHALTLLIALRSRTRAFDTSVNYGIIYKILKVTIDENDRLQT